MNQEVRRIDSVFVPVTNLQRSEEWYLKMFNLKVIFRSSDGVYVGFRFQDAPSNATALTIYKTSVVPESKHIAFNFYASDVDATYDYFKSQNVWVTEMEGGDGMRFFDCKDPDGNMLGVVWFPE